MFPLSLTSGEIKLGEVDCTQNSDLCMEAGVKGYPTMVLYRNGLKHTEYIHNRDYER